MVGSRATLGEPTVVARALVHSLRKAGESPDLFNDRVMSPGSATQNPTPAAAALANRLAAETGAALAEERHRGAWTVREVARRARLSAATVTNVEAGRPASHLTYARLATALGSSIRIDLAGQRRRAREPRDLVHAAMGELEASWFHQHGFQVAVDHPYQHYQFAG